MNEDEREGLVEEEKEAGVRIDPEIRLISYILRTKDLVSVRSSGVDAGLFDANQDVYAGIEDYYERYGRVPSYEDLVQFLGKDFDFIEDIDSDLEYLIRDLKEVMVYNMASQFIVKASGDIETEDAVDVVKSLIANLQESIRTAKLNNSKGSDLWKDWQIGYDSYLQRMDMRDKLGCTLGFPEFDQKVGGVWQNDFLGVVGRPGQGKSWLIEYLLLKAWETGKHVLFFTLENSKVVVQYRAHTLLGHFSNFSIVRGSDVVKWKDKMPVATNEDYYQYVSSMGVNSNIPFIVYDTDDADGNGFTIEDILAIAEELQPDVIGIDQLSLILPTPAKKGQYQRSIREQYIHITRTIRRWVNKHNIPVYLACQAGRDAAKNKGKDKDNTPEIHQIAESDSVGQDATKILSLHNDADNILKVSLKKNTNGPAGIDVVRKWIIDEGQFMSAQVDEDHPEESF